MSDITLWSPIDEDPANKVAAPDGFPEPMPAGVVNDSCRAVMGAVRRHAEDGGWFDWGHTYAFVDASRFTVDPGTDHTAIYTVDRRVRVGHATSPTVYGTIVSYNNVSGEVEVATDSGSIASDINSVAVGPEVTAAPPPDVGVPIGGVIAWTAAALPDGFVECNGQALNAGTTPAYQSLFDVIGNTYGGTNNTDFQVPDLTGRAIAGKEATATRLTTGGSGIDGGVLGDAGGAETHQLDVSEMPSHSHTRGWVGGLFGDNGNAVTVSTVSSINTGSAGGDAPHQNTQPTFILIWIIRAT